LHSQNHQQLRTGADPAWITIAENQTLTTFIGCYLSPLSCHKEKISQSLINLNRLVKSIKTGHISSTGKKFCPAGRRIDGARIYEPSIINGKNLAYRLNSGLHHCLSIILLRNDTAE
jgi:hypothetical protein